MAEFKISRFRYTWKSNWNTATAYIKDDIVRYGGSTWVCIRQHTSTTFDADLNYIPPGDTVPAPNWTKMSDGYAFRGNWTASGTLYNENDIVFYSGILYKCIDSHTSQSTFVDNSADWEIYVSSGNIRNDWQTSTRYGIGDIIRYGGIVYKCITEHTSASTEDLGLELDQSSWIEYFENVEYLGEWQDDTRYKLNDLVTYNGSLLRCNEGHDSFTEFSDEKWDIELPGFEFDEEWNSSTYYGIGSVIRHGGYLYYCVKANLNKVPVNSVYQIEIDGPFWEILSKGINFRGVWSSAQTYKTGDVVRRGGNLYVAILDTVADGSSLDYLDSSNWELLTVGQNWRNSWQEDSVYAVNDLVIYKGSVYKANIEHTADDQNFPGDNGSGFAYWDLVIVGDEAGMSDRGDLLTYDLSRELAGDGSTFGITNVPIGNEGQLLSINNEGSVFYKNYGDIQRVFYVSLEGEDDEFDPRRGKTPELPYRTIRFACEKADDGFDGFTTVSISPGKFEEVLPIIVPKRTVVLGSELRSTTIAAKGPIEELSLDSTYTIAVLNRITEIIDAVLRGTAFTKTITNPLSATVLTTTIVTNIPFVPPQFDQQGNEIYQSSTSETVILPVSESVSESVVELIDDIVDYINFYVNSIGNTPSIVGTNTATTDQNYLNAALVLEANKSFLESEAVAFMQSTYPNYNFDPESCKRDVRRYIDAWKYDLTYSGNYKSILAARYYRNAVLGSSSEDMFYLRDATGLRDCTLRGLSGVLNPPNVFDLYRRPTGGAYCSLDPGWGPADDRTWIITRSPYIQGVTTFGTGCVGQKIDGALHNGGNRSFVSNDFTQVLDDGIGAWVTNNGRAELVSVFTYYCQVGYLAEEGGIIRATNGNNSYGRFGAIADGNDPTEVPRSGEVFNRNQEAIVAQAFAGEVNDEILLLEWSNAGQNYTQASANFVGSGANALVKFEDFRDNAVFQARLLDSTPEAVSQNVGGGGYTLVGNNAQVSTPPSIDQTGITIAANDSGSEAEYLGLRLLITSGVGTGQYGIITGYNTGTKVVTVKRESDDQPGWDHVIPGTPNQTFLTSTTYRIEPRPIFSDPGFSSTSIDLGVSTDWSAITYGETTRTYSNVAGSAGTGIVIEDDGLTPILARWNVTKNGRDYVVELNNPGAGYAINQVVTILGTDLGGATPYNDITITVTGTTDDSTNAITTFTYDGIGTSGNFVAVSSTTSTAGVYSPDGITWTAFNLPSSGDWKSIAAGNNRFVAIRYGSSAAASSLNGESWTARTMPSSRNWNAVTYGDGIFVAVAGNLNSGAISSNGTTWTATTLPTVGDSTINEWVDITYGKNKFVAIANSSNICAVGEYNSGTGTITWAGHVMDVINDSSQRDWVSVTYGNNRFVAISNTGDVAYSFDGINWLPATMPTQDGSTVHGWKKIKYAQGVFFAVGDSASRDVGGDTTTGPSTFAATSEDGIVWTPKILSDSAEWRDIAFGNPYIDSEDSSLGLNTPIWVAIATGTADAARIRTGAKAKGRVITGAGVVSEVRLWDPGSGYLESPTLTIVDPNNTSDAIFDCRLADGVLANPSWINRGISYRTSTTTVTITGDGFADIIPVGRFITISALPNYPGPGAQITFAGKDQIYTVVTVSSVTANVGGDGFSARLRISPELKTRDNIEHGTTVSIREKYSQCRITGHDFLDIGTGNFTETNYPELYATGQYVPAPENEVVEEQGGRVFYTATDQTGNFRAGELFAVEQATGIVTISADFFDLQGLSELALGGVRLGGSGAVVREFSTDPLFTDDSNNIVPTQRAIRAYLNNRLTVGGSEIATSSFIAGTVRVGPTFIGNTASLKIVIPKRAVFEGADCHISGSILAQTMFFRSFNLDS